jgi:catechol 2,3-dioxygenase-like lactoylglutathione lyase family enzyme
VTDAIRACTPVIYVADLPSSVRFYELLGLSQQASGDDGEWSYTYLKCGPVGLLLAAGATAVHTPDGPVTLYLQVLDADAISACLTEGGVQVEHLGYPDHAPGGELKVADPDGHVVLLGQVSGAPPAGHVPADDPHARASVLRRSAEAARRRGLPPQPCQIPVSSGGPCGSAAEVKLTDSWGDSVWACLPHAEEVMVNVPSAFVANEDADGLTSYVRRRGHRPR